MGKLDVFKSDFFRSSFKLSIGTTIAQAIPVILSPILTRLYSPSDFGVLGLYLSLSGILMTMASGSYELAIMLPEKNKDAINVAALSFCIVIVFCIVLYFITTLFNLDICRFLHNSDLSQWLYYLPFVLFFLAGIQILNYFFTRRKKYGKLAMAQSGQGLVIGIVYLAAGFLKIGNIGLMWGRFLGAIFAFIFLIASLFNRAKLKTLISNISFNQMKKVGRRYIDFPKFSLLSRTINTASIQMTPILLAIFFSSNVVGFYSLAARAIFLPTALVGKSISQVFFQKASLLVGDKEALRNLTLNLYKNMLFICLIPIIVLMMFGGHIFSFVFGAKWYIAGQYAQVLSIWILFVFIGSPLSVLFNVLEKQKQSLFFNGMLFLSRIVMVIIGGAIIANSYLTIVLFGIIGAIFWFFFCCYLLNLVGIAYIKTIRITALPVVPVIVGMFCLRVLLRSL